MDCSDEVKPFPFPADCSHEVKPFPLPLELEALPVQSARTRKRERQKKNKSVMMAKAKTMQENHAKATEQRRNELSNRLKSKMDRKRDKNDDIANITKAIQDQGMMDKIAALLKRNPELLNLLPK